MIACTVLALVGLAAGYGVRGVLPGNVTSDLSTNLYSSWRAQMNVVVYVAKPILPRRQSVRLHQVFDLQGQNQRAAGMARVMQALRNGGATLSALAGDLIEINTGIDRMLMLMYGGYTGKQSSRASPADLRYIRNLVQERILRRLPAVLSSDVAAQNALPKLQSIGAYIFHQVNVRFVRPVGGT